MTFLRFGALYAAVIILVSCGDPTPSPEVVATKEVTADSPTAIAEETQTAPYYHTYANRCGRGSCTDSGHTHANGYTDVGADQYADTGTHGHADGYTDVGADQYADTGAHSYTDAPIPSP